MCCLCGTLLAEGVGISWSNACRVSNGSPQSGGGVLGLCRKVVV